MKLRLTQSGYEKFNGILGHIEFVDGLSSSDVSQADAARITCAINARWEDGKDPSPSAALIANMDQPAPVLKQPVTDSVKTDKPDEETDPKPVYTEEELEEIVDKGGIKKLREITNQFDIRSNSAAELINMMVKSGHARKSEK